MSEWNIRWARKYLVNYCTLLTTLPSTVCLFVCFFVEITCLRRTDPFPKRVLRVCVHSNAGQTTCSRTLIKPVPIFQLVPLVTPFSFLFFRFRFRSCGAPSTKLFARTSMTNVSAGAKRSWEGHHHYHHGESDGRPRSPSYVHSNPPPYKRQRGREEGRGWREEKRGKRDSRERREYRSRERERDRDRERERDRNRERERDSRRAHEHNKDHDKHDTREKERRRKDDERRRTPAVASNGRPSVPPPQKVDSDREEGE